jgi:hypothetical protein
MTQATHLEAIRQGLWRAIAFGLLSISVLPLYAQKVGEVDLTSEVPTVDKKSVPTAECEGVENGFTLSDGFIVPQGDRLKLELRINSLSSLKPALGEAVEAEIALKNIDRSDIVIPWSTDPNTANRPPAATHHEYESASVSIRMKDENGKEELLKSLPHPLYSSTAQPQSSLKLLPGQWVTMRIKFSLLVDEERPSRSLASGPAELRVQWRQGSFSWEHKGCDFTFGYSTYSTFYEQITDPVKILLVSSKEDEARDNPQSKSDPRNPL